MVSGGGGFTGEVPLGKCLGKPLGWGPPDNIIPYAPYIVGIYWVYPLVEHVHDIYSNVIVDGRHPKQPPGMYKTFQIMGYTAFQLVQDFFHQQYHIMICTS